MIRQTAKRVLPASVQKRIRCALSFARQMRRQCYRQLVSDKHFRSIKRTSRDQCWCGGKLSDFPEHPSYGVCQRCGCYVNRRPPLREELLRFYSWELYWNIKQRADGLPVIEKRSAHDLADGRVKHWLELIQRFAPSKGVAIEIGCAHGVLLGCLRQHGYDCIGVDIDPKLADWTRCQTGVDVRAGVFPGVELPACDLFLSFDVLEHAPEPEAFMREASRLLRLGGVAIIQTAIDREHKSPPFGRKFADAFDDLEHLFLFTDDAMRELADRAGLTVVTLSEALWPMGEICVFRKESRT